MYVRLFKSFQAKLFIAYSLVLILITVLVSIPMYFHLKQRIEQSIHDTVNQMIRGYNDSFDRHIKQFEQITYQSYLNVDYSEKTPIDYIRNRAFSSNSSEIFQADRSLSNFVSLVSGTYRDIYRISIITNNGILYSNKSLTDKTSLTDSGWMELARQADGLYIIQYAQGDHWLEQDDTPMIVITSLLDPNGARQGFLQIHVQLSDLIDTALLSNYPGAELTFSRYGQVIYHSSQQDKELQRQPVMSFFSHQSQQTGLTIDLAVPNRTVYKSLYVFRRAMMLLVALLIAFTLLVIYILSRTLTSPLTRLKKVIDKINLDNPAGLIENKYKQNEIEVINQAFRHMNNRLQHSLEQVVQFRTLQLQSHFNTLQAQINPHFLFNILGVVNVLADEGDNRQIFRITSNLADFLRYSIDTKSPVAPLSQELEFAEKYLELMSSRYLDRLGYTIDVDKELYRLLLPRLTLQPLVENSIHHGFGGTPRLCIEIKGCLKGDRWELIVQDNGAGFSGDTLAALNRQLEAYLDKARENPDEQYLTFGGMGLLSTYARLKLHYKEHLSFVVENNQDKGACIRISGRL